MSVLIFANGEISHMGWLRPFLAQASVIIAADGGSRHLYRLERAPDVIIGDLDSVSPEILDWLQHAGTSVIEHDPAKDETDLELALLFARQYRQEILIFGALGGRLDQTLANILLLAHPALVNHTIQLVEEHERAWLIVDHSRFKGTPGDIVSLIPLGGDVLVKEATGLRWPLQDSVLAFGPARGVSNEITAVSVSIEIASGTLLCVHQEKK